MNTLKLDVKDGIAIVQIQRPKVNAITRDMAAELVETFVELAEAKHIQGAILTGSGNVFSAGLDLMEIYSYDEDTLAHFWRTFHQAVVQMAGFPKPLVGAINGHAPAGGCVFAMCCDYRVMADGDFRIGLNEVPVGIVMPYALVQLTRFAVGDRKAEQMLLNGHLMTPHEATAFGLIDAHCAPGELMTWAEMHLNRWLTTHQDAWRGTKTATRAPLLEALNLTLEQGYGAMLREWWSIDSRHRIGKTIENIRAGKKAPKA